MLSRLLSSPKGGRRRKGKEHVSLSQAAYRREVNTAVGSGVAEQTASPHYISLTGKIEGFAFRGTENAAFLEMRLPADRIFCRGRKRKGAKISYDQKENHNFVGAAGASRLRDDSAGRARKGRMEKKEGRLI